MSWSRARNCSSRLSSPASMRRMSVTTASTPASCSRLVFSVSTHIQLPVDDRYRPRQRRLAPGSASISTHEATALA